MATSPTGSVRRFFDRNGTRSYNCGMTMLALIVTCSCCAATILVAQQSPLVDPYGHIDKLVQALYTEAWRGPESICIPLCWDFQFTAPMRVLLDIGQKAQPRLLLMIGAVAIRDQVIILLGGVGDERSIGPIIETMKSASSEAPSDQRRRTLTAGNLALTNITVAEVIWHHGGGIPLEACHNDPAACWSAWWERNRETFRVKDIKVSRRYSNYPNYGIYHGLP
jgi:hypothetical protein